jgi:hypothetical protein
MKAIPRIPSIMIVESDEPLTASFLRVAQRPSAVLRRQTCIAGRSYASKGELHTS